MINVSDEFRRLISQNTKVEFKATLALADGTVRNLTGDDVMMGSPMITSGTSSTSSFDVGSAVMGQLKIALNNFDGSFDPYDFTDATITPFVGVRLGNGGVEWVRKGDYIVEQPKSYGSTIELKCLDYLSKFERPYAEVATQYPATLQTIVLDMCSVCGVLMESGEFANCQYVVQERPGGSSLTCLAVLSYVAQVAGCFARMTNAGTLRIAWYDTSAFEAEDWLDGETFDGASPYQSGDTADGGGFLDYSQGDSYDGGPFSRRPWASIHAYGSMSISTDDVVVTGVQVTACDDKPSEGGGTGNDGETSLFGSQGYVLEITNNPLVTYGTAEQVAAQVGARVVGMRFRPLDVSALGDPTIEAGDPIIVTDRKQNSYRAYATSVIYKIGSYQSISCGAETPSRNQASVFSAITKAIVDSRNAVKEERTNRQLAISQLAQELEESSGLYRTEVAQQDGSTILYMHDKPTLAESAIVWKMTAEAVGISIDGGQTYSYGIDATGSAILDRVYAIGIDAQYINAGRVSFGGGGWIDFALGTMGLGVGSALGDGTVQGMLDGISDAARTATDYFTFSGGELTIGAEGSAVKNVLTNSRMVYRTSQSDVAWFGLNDGGIWEMFIETARVQNRLGFGQFYWFARDNGNMTLKWTEV